jgi:starch synthase
MRVGIVSFTDVDSGIDLANAIAEAGASVVFYSSRSHTIRTVGDSEHPIERLYQMRLLRLDVKVRLIQLHRMRNPQMIYVMHSIAKMIQNDGVDVAHILIGGGELWTAVLANLLKRIPVVSTIIIPKPNIGEFPPPWVVIMVNRLIIHGSDAIIVNGKDHVSMTHKVYNYPVERVYYIPLGPRNVFLKWCVRDLSEENGTILFLGRIHKHKGLEYLIKAQPLISARMPLAHIVIAGQGEDLERCRGLIADPNKFEIHDGFIPGEIVAELFQRASVIAVPYLTAATSGILMTAYVFGKPVVATRVGSLPEYVQDGDTGILVDPGNEIQLAEALFRLLSNNSLRRQMGENAVQWVQGELGWKNIAAQTLKVYLEAVNHFTIRQGRNA